MICVIAKLKWRLEVVLHHAMEWKCTIIDSRVRRRPVYLQPFAAPHRSRHCFCVGHQLHYIEKSRIRLMQNDSCLKQVLVCNTKVFHRKGLLWISYKVFHDGVENLILNPVSLVGSVQCSLFISSSNDNRNAVHAQFKMLQYNQLVLIVATIKTWRYF